MALLEKLIAGGLGITGASHPGHPAQPMAGLGFVLGFGFLAMGEAVFLPYQGNGN